MGGYCATGKENTATPPASVMTIDSTAAKIGRSMKKWEIMVGPPFGIEDSQLPSIFDPPGHLVPLSPFEPSAELPRVGMECFST